MWNGKAALFLSAQARLFFITQLAKYSWPTGDRRRSDFPGLLAMGALSSVIRGVHGPALRLITPDTAVEHPPLVEFELAAAAHRER